MKLARLGEGPEIFFSLQGEGKNLGAPSVFVRTSRCNLYCTWCDTPYTWNWLGSAFRHQSATKFEPLDHTIELEPREVAEWVQRWPCRRLVLTGGEPLLQTDACRQLLEELGRDGTKHACEIETNGTLVPSPALDALVEQYNVSPKLAHSGVERAHRLRDEALAFFAGTEKSVFKFVVRDASDVAEIEELARRYQLERDRIYLMPEGTDARALTSARSALARICLDGGYRLSDRLHIHLFGNQPGV